MPTHASLWEAVKAAGIPHASHETDLYIPANPQTRAILKDFPLEYKNKRIFKNQVEGGLWYDIPFAYLPAWEEKMKRH